VGSITGKLIFPSGGASIGQLVSAIDRDRVARQLVEGTGCSLKDFCNHHSESFDGKGDHTSADVPTSRRWLTLLIS
jgi:hypothetical protein